MTEPNYLGLALWFLGPSSYFIVTGALIAGRVDWNLVVLGLIPGIGLVACVSEIRDLLSGFRSARRRGGAGRRSDVQKTPRVFGSAVASTGHS